MEPEPIFADTSMNTTERVYRASDPAIVQALAVRKACHEAGLLDEHGNLRKIIGTLPMTKDGCVVGHGASLHYPEEPYEESLAAESDRVFFEVVGTDSLGETCGGWVETNRCYSTREAAERAAKGGGDGH